ncbi:vWA domain-containing protein [Neisseria cinerea]|uniref:VWA domain-containing protein n=1 Tax=Neisseria cinerea TaxID=483 RepID=UPI002B1D670A|nr:VWA domain-containing protein [Neisseria cinerea]
MKEALYIIVDVSGSMNEMGKIHLQRNLCRYAAQLRGIDQQKYADLDIRFYQWAQDILKITIQTDGDIPSLNAEGSSNLCDLYDFLFQHLNDSGSARILILSDGNFPNSDIVSFQKQLGTFSNLIIRTVAVGADADLLKLKKISTNNTVYLSENIASAIDSTIFGSDEPLTAPVSTAGILESVPAETEEQEEDWDA